MKRMKIAAALILAACFTVLPPYSLAAAYRAEHSSAAPPQGETQPSESPDTPDSPPDNPAESPDTPQQPDIPGDTPEGPSSPEQPAGTRKTAAATESATVHNLHGQRRKSPFGRGQRLQSGGFGGKRYFVCGGGKNGKLVLRVLPRQKSISFRNVRQRVHAGKKR